MSGICGIVDLSGPVSREVLDRMVEAARHRRPAGVGTLVQGGVALARLVSLVTPESVGERQPVMGSGGAEVLVADARLDNRAELLGALTEAGAHSTDAELILAAYRRWGTGCPERLLGDFAFALWDGRRSRLLAARDAAGMRSLYYRIDPRRLLFATEVAQILAVPGVVARPFEPSLAAHLAVVSGPPEWTAWEGIVSLPPAHAMVVDHRGPRTWRFWEADPDRRIVHSDPRDYAAQFRELFVEAVRCRLRSVKPVAIVLSGGLDSGSVASAAGWLLRQGGSLPEVRAYCWAFSDLPQCDERQLSGGIVDHYGLPLTEVPVETAWPLQGYPAHGPDRDDPFAGPYQRLWDATMARAREEGVGLLLSGGRGDLLVGAGVFDDLGLLFGGRLTDLAADLRSHRQSTGASLPRTLADVLVRPAAAQLWPPSRAPSLRGRLAGVRPLPAWIPAAFAERVGLPEIIARSRPQGPAYGYARRQRYEAIAAFMHVRAAVWLERTGARSDLAYADPWADRRLAEFVLAVPQWVVQRRSQLKSIAREAMRGIMPEPVRHRVTKTTPQPFFELAMRTWARDGVRELTNGTSAAARGYVDEPALRAHYSAFLDGRPLAGAFWWALTLEMWLRNYVRDG